MHFIHTVFTLSKSQYESSFFKKPRAFYRNVPKFVQRHRAEEEVHTHRNRKFNIFRFFNFFSEIGGLWSTSFRSAGESGRGGVVEEHANPFPRAIFGDDLRNDRHFFRPHRPRKFFDRNSAQIFGLNRPKNFMLGPFV